MKLILAGTVAAIFVPFIAILAILVLVAGPLSVADEPTPQPDPGPQEPAPGGHCDVDGLLPRPNPRSCPQAIAWVRDQTNGSCRWERLCLGVTAHAYGWAAAGEYSAADHWQRMTSVNLAHAGDRRPPAGALVFWAGGSEGFGHVAIAVDGRRIASNDIARRGCIDIVDRAAPETQWGLTYLGWTPPYFPHGHGRDG